MKIVAYHWSPEKFTEFDKKYIGSTNSSTYLDGFYFADKLVPPNEGYIYKCELTLNNPIEIDVQSSGWDTLGTQEAIDAFVNHDDWGYIQDYLEDNLNMDTEEAESLLEKWENADGAILTNVSYDYHDTEYIVFDPSQIKILERTDLNDRVLSENIYEQLNEVGYDWSKGMSNNAVSAYESGEKPLSKWKKADILAEVKKLNPSDEIMEKLKGIKVNDLKDICLYQSSWHHTSKYYNETNFYSIYDSLDEIEGNLEEYLKRNRDKEATQGLINYILANGTGDNYWKTVTLEEPIENGKFRQIKEISYSPYFKSFSVMGTDGTETVLDITKQELLNGLKVQNETSTTKRHESLHSEGLTNIMTETKEKVNPFNQNFYKWFGNSKIVNADGTPKVVSHRSNKTFDRFDKDKISSYNLNGKGFYFSDSDDKGKKNSYGKNIGYYYLKMENPVYKSAWVDRETLEKYFDPDVVVYIFNRVKTSTARQGDKVQWVMVFFNLWNYRMDFGKDLHVEEVLKDMGYDGIIDDMIENTYVVFEPNQIKSVDNKGMWSDSDNIYEQLNKLFEELL